MEMDPKEDEDGQRGPVCDGKEDRVGWSALVPWNKEA